jgi:hypothetical protein
VIKKGYEVCSDCKEYPCKRFESEKEGYDSFVTHKNVFPNLDLIRDEGIRKFVEVQKSRIDILNYLLTGFDDGRAKSFYCLSCALLPLEKIIEIHDFAHDLSDGIGLKEKVKLVRNFITGVADSINIELKLNSRE